MRYTLLSLCLISLAACGEVAAPDDARLDPRFDETWVDVGTSGRTTFSSSAIIPGCAPTYTHEVTRGCTITIGETKLVGWFIEGGAAAVSGIRSPAQLSMLVGPAPSDTIPGPPTIGGLRAALNSSGMSALNAFVAAAGINPLSDTIPGPPTRFIYAQRNAAGEYEGNALILFSVNELVAKKVIAPSTVGTEFAVAWRGVNGASYVAAGILPPSDTIPGPPTRTR